MLCSTVVISGNYDNRHPWISIANLNQRLREHSLNCSRWLSRMIHIATKQKYIRLLLFHGFHHLTQHRLLLLSAIVVVQCVTKMPVTCMENLHFYQF